MGKPLLESNSLLYFADVCAGPGGFSEYVLWRKRWRAKGFGFTIKGKNDFKLEDFLAGSRKCSNLLCIRQYSVCLHIHIQGFGVLGGYLPLFEDSKGGNFQNSY